MDLLENVASLEWGVRIKLGVSGAFYGARSRGGLSHYQPGLCSLSSALPVLGINLMLIYTNPRSFSVYHKEYRSCSVYYTAVTQSWLVGWRRSDSTAVL